jgi:hypothetical protein
MEQAYHKKINNIFIHINITGILLVLYNTICLSYKGQYLLHVCNYYNKFIFIRNILCNLICIYDMHILSTLLGQLYIDESVRC